MKAVQVHIVVLVTTFCFAMSAVVFGNGPASFDSPRLQAECSWLGNSFPGAEAWVQQDIRALTVTPDGSVFTNVEFPADARPIAFCISHEGQLYVADDGPAQRILVFRASGGRQIRTIGHHGGIYSGIPGAFGDLKFNQITAIGLDAAGNLYVAHDGQSGGGGTVLESYSPDEPEKLRWRLFGLTFVDMADVDAAGDIDVFTKEEHFRIDYSKPPGAMKVTCQRYLAMMKQYLS